MTARRGPALAPAVALLLALALAAGACGSGPSLLEAQTGESAGPDSGDVSVSGEQAAAQPAPTYTLDPYRGLGTWVDVFDWSPRFAGDNGPAVGPADVEAMAEAGVRTIYLQAARHEQDVFGGIPDPELVGEFLVAAHDRGMAVVAWYLPRRYDGDDLERLRALRDFRAGEHAFDGIALDIEWRKDVPDLDARNAALVEFSGRVRAEFGEAVIGAIVLPPVLLEVVNEQYWASFPWRGIAPFFEVWLPMSYWTDRTWASGYQDPYVYTDETIRRLRANLGLPEAVVHVVGGIGDGIDSDDYAALGRAVTEHGAIGVSIYDWDTTAADQRPLLVQGMG